jgi:hypothetical protein
MQTHKPIPTDPSASGAATTATATTDSGAYTNSYPGTAKFPYRRRVGKR